MTPISRLARLAVFALLPTAGCLSVSPPPAASSAPAATGAPGGDSDPCGVSVTTEVPAADLPFDISELAERSGLRVSPGVWASGEFVDVSIQADVVADVAFFLTPADATCPYEETWLVDVQVGAWTGAGELSAEWGDLVPADVAATWSLGTVLSEADALELRAAAGLAEPTSTEPYASIALTWDEDVEGSVITRVDDEDTDASVTLLSFGP